MQEQPEVRVRLRRGRENSDPVRCGRPTIANSLPLVDSDEPQLGAPSAAAVPFERSAQQRPLHADRQGSTGRRVLFGGECRWLTG